MARDAVRAGLRLLAIVVAACAVTPAAAQRTGGTPLLTVAPPEFKVKAGDTSDAFTAELSWPANAALPTAGLPLVVGLPRSIESLVRIDPPQPVFAFARGSRAASTRFRFVTAPATPRGRYRLIVHAGERESNVVVFVLEVDNVRGLPPGPPLPQEQEQEASIAVPLAALAELAIAAPAGSNPGAFALGPTTQTVYGGALELPAGLTTIVAGHAGWDRQLRLAWRSPHSKQFAWKWEVSLQPFAAAGDGASQVLASKLIPSVPAAGDIATFLIDFNQVPPLGKAPSTATDGASGQAEVAVVPGATAALPGDATRGGVRNAVAEQAAGARTAAAAANESANVAVPGNLAVPEFPMDFHIRIVPLLPDNEPAGPPSNAVVLHYEPAVDPASVEALEAAKAQAAIDHALANLEQQAGQLYSLEILDWKPVVFENPNRFGCVNILEKGPIPIGFSTGELCPKPYRGKGNNFDLSDLDPVAIAEGLADFASGLYGDLKSGILDLAMDVLPCPSGQEAACRAALTTAMDAALASAGIPPSLPNFDEIKAAAKGELVDLAMETALNELPGGVVCKGVPECEAQLRNAIEQGLDESIDLLTAKAAEPHCGKGHHPLPCFNQYPGWKVVPAKGAVYEPFTARIRVTRNPVPMPAGLVPAACRVGIDLVLDNHLTSGLFGQPYAKQKIENVELHGKPFDAVYAPLPPLAPGESTTVTLAFVKYQHYVVPGFDAKNHIYILMQHWLALYGKGSGSLSASTRANAEIVENGKLLAQKQVACGPATSQTVVIP